MGLSVRERGEAVATYRFIQVSLMETLARWVPSTPEMEAKLLFGAHIWDVAQHADALGKRTYELRLPLQFSLKPCGPYAELLEELRAVADTSRRLAGFYDVMLPALAARYRRFLERTDPLMDAPTVRILERILQDEARMVGEGRALRAELAHLRLTDTEWAPRFAEREAAVEEIFQGRPDAVGAAR